MSKKVKEREAVVIKFAQEAMGAIGPLAEKHELSIIETVSGMKILIESMVEILGKKVQPPVKH